jgi:hypothetical protein
MLRRILTISAALILGFPVVGHAQENKMTKFTVRIENISSPEGMKGSDGSKWPFAMSPGLYVVHTEKAPLFTSGKKAGGKGLEAQAEDGNPEPLSKSLRDQKGVKSVGIFNTPMGANEPDAIGPGGAYEFSFSAAPGSRLTITSMFGQSNDLFYAPSEAGIPLYKDGKPISGDITSQIILWDAGTEVNQEPGIGSDQAPRQKAPNTGKDENGMVQNIKNIKDGYTYPKTASVMRVTITVAKAPQN